MISRRKIALTLLLLCSAFSYAQNASLYEFNHLSSLYFSKQTDSLKKAWVCKEEFDKKVTQKKFKEIWDERTEFLIKSLKDNDYVYSSEIQAYLEGIVEQLVNANKKYFPVKPLVLIDRSSDVNAYAVGSNVFAVNLGMLTFARNREELALIIAHELSHNIMQHPENSMKSRAQWLTSDEYKASLNAVLDSKYERYTRLKKVFEEYKFGRSRHQRYKESEADSMALVLLQNSRIPFDPISFLRLDSSDLHYQQNLKAPLKNYLSAYGVEVNEAWMKKRSKGLSTRNYGFKDSARLADSLKTHPDCTERYELTRKFATQGATFTPVPASIVEKANKMLIWKLYQNKSLTPCLYRVLLEKDKGNTDPWYDFMFYTVFAGLTVADNDLSRFNAIGVVPKEYVSTSYYELQTMLEQIPRENLHKICKQLHDAPFWNNMPVEEKAFRSFAYALASDVEGKKRSESAREFARRYSSSLYREFAEIFQKK